MVHRIRCCDTFGATTHPMLCQIRGLQGCKLFGELVAAWCVESTGRRPLMVWGNTAMSLAVFGIATSFYLKASALVTVVCLSLVRHSRWLSHSRLLRHPRSASHSPCHLSPGCCVIPGRCVIPD